MSEIEEAKSEALAPASAKDFKSHNPYFVVTMKESHVDGRGRGMVNILHLYINKSPITNIVCVLC